MKKLLLCTAVLAAFTGVGATHAMGLGILDTEVGYSYNGAKDGIHAAHIEVTPFDKVTVGAEFRHWKHAGDETDIYAKYHIGKFYVGLGNRNYYDRDAKIFGMVGAKTQLVGPLDAYAGLKVSSEEREYRAGFQLDVIPSTIDVDLNYTYYDRDDTKNEDGIGVGLNYHF